MTCQHCQTWILDDDHRCRRCGRRVRSTPARISPHTFPIAAAATARDYDFAHDFVSRPAPTPMGAVEAAPPVQAGQQALFATSVLEPRVIPFESLTKPAEWKSIRDRAAERPRPTPLATGRVEVKRARPKKVRSDAQRKLEFQGQEQVLAPPESSIICDAPVAPVALRLQAGAIDSVLMGCGCALLAAALLYASRGSALALDKHVLPLLLLAFLTVPLAYKLLWTFVARDTPGVQLAGLRLVDFDGNPPSAGRRYYRLFGSFLSLSAAAVGLIWCLVDEDRLTWHDHISNTFLTFAPGQEE